MVARASRHRQVFISHVPEDRDFARGVSAELAKAGFKTSSMDDVFPGDNAYLQLGHALESADAMVILLSPEAVHSPNLSFELGYALGSTRFEHRVVPVLVRKTKDVPWILSRFAAIPPGKNPRAVGKQIVSRLRQTVEP